MEGTEKLEIAITHLDTEIESQVQVTHLAVVMEKVAEQYILTKALERIEYVYLLYSRIDSKFFKVSKFHLNLINLVMRGLTLTTSLVYNALFTHPYKEKYF